MFSCSSRRGGCPALRGSGARHLCPGSPRWCGAAPSLSSCSYHLSFNLSESQAKDTCSSTAKSFSSTYSFRPPRPPRWSHGRRRLRFLSPGPIQCSLPPAGLVNFAWLQAQHQMQGNRSGHQQPQLPGDPSSASLLDFTLTTTVVSAYPPTENYTFKCDCWEFEAKHQRNRRSGTLGF